MNRLEDLREWLMDRIDGSEETRGDDSLISDFIRQIDALPSETGPIPASKTQAKRFAAQMVEPRGCPTPGSCSAVEELADLKQRLLPQFQGRAQRAEHERDAMLEKLIVRQTTIANLHDVIDGMRGAVSSATAAPVAWMYEEDGERMFGHPDGYRPKNAVPLYAAPAEVAESDRPDWARQLPGAELYDRAARYEYLRTLNPRQFAALYDEALHGDRFDDLVDRYRDAGEKP